MLNYQEIGEGPPVLLVHGWAMSFAIWRDLAPLLSLHYRLVMVELPGIGASPPVAGQPTTYHAACATALDELRQHLGLAHWAVLGYSAGAWPSLAYAQAYPAHVSHLILLCAAKVQGWRLGFLRLVVAGDRLWPAWGSWMLRQWRLYGLVRFLGFNLQPHPDAHLWTQEIDRQTMAVRKTSVWAALAAHPLRELPPVPTRWIWGRSDILARVPRPLGPQDRVIEGNHSAPMGAAAAVAAEVRAFLG